MKLEIKLDDPKSREKNGEGRCLQEKKMKKLTKKQINRQYKKLIQPYPKGLQGWVCPVCGKGLSPYTTECNCNRQYTITCSLDNFTTAKGSFK